VRVCTSQVYVALPIVVPTVSVVVSVKLNVRGSYCIKVAVGIQDVFVIVSNEANDETTVLVSVALEVTVLT